MVEKIRPFKKGDVVCFKGLFWVVDEDEAEGKVGFRVLAGLLKVDADECFPSSTGRDGGPLTRVMVFACDAVGGHAVLEETTPGYGWWEGRLVPGSGLRFEVDVTLEEVQAKGEVPRFALKAYQHGDVYVKVYATLDYDGLAEWFLRVQRWFE